MFHCLPNRGIDISPIIALGAAVAAAAIVRTLEYIPIRFELAEGFASSSSISYFIAF